MNWYVKSKFCERLSKISQTQPNLLPARDLELDKDRAQNRFYEIYDEQKQDLIEEFLQRVPGSCQSWRPVPFARVKKIWQDFATYHIVRDEKGMDEIASLTLENIAKLLINTELAGHTSTDPEDDFNMYGFTEQDKQDFWDAWTYDKKSNDRISDSKINPLLIEAEKLLLARTSEEKLMIVDIIFNMVHPRGDLSSCFIEGGQRSLNMLAG